jgi:penicillin-binding protein 1A
MGKRETGGSVAVPVFYNFMETALKDAPILPFRVPPGIRQVQINAENGVRARPGDKRVIWEAFVAGTEPTDKMFILNGDSIGPLATLHRDTALPGDGVDTEVVGDEPIILPYPESDDYIGGVDQQSVPASGYTPVAPATNDMTGTGGLY